MKVLIVEDEENQIELLHRFLSGYDFVSEINSAETVEEFYNFVIEDRPDLILLDIGLHNQNSLEVLRKLDNEDFFLPQIIITTTHNEQSYHKEAQDLFSINYLLKPVQETDLKRAVIHAYKTIHNNTEQKKEYSNVRNFVKNYNRLIFETLTSKNIFVEPDEIAYAKSSGNYAEIFFTDGNSTMVNKGLGIVENKLPSNIFYRISRQYIVNLNKIRSISKKRKKIEFGSLSLENIPIPEDKVNILIKILKDSSPY